MEVLTEVADGIWRWAVFNEPRQLDFNGLYLRLGSDAVLIDPVDLSDAVVRDLERLGAPSRILLTNKDHRRAAPAAKARFGAPIAIHEADAALVDCAIDETFADGDELSGGLRVVQVPDSKSPGESAFFWPARRILIVGDALVGKPAGSLSLLPDEKFADPARARAGIRRLADLEPETLLVGDGVSLIGTAREALAGFLAGAPSLPKPSAPPAVRGC